MSPICFICNSSNINNNCKCMTCKKSVCKKCYIKLIEEDNDNIKYKCPFCKIITQREIYDLDKDIIYNFMKMKNYKLQNKNNISKDVINHLRDELFLLQSQNEYLNILLNSQNIGQKKENSYKQFFKENFKELKLKNPDMSPQNIVKEIGILWKIKKNDK